MAKRKGSKKQLNSRPEPRPKQSEVISLATNLVIDAEAYWLLKEAAERAESGRQSNLR